MIVDFCLLVGVAHKHTTLHHGNSILKAIESAAYAAAAASFSSASNATIAHSTYVCVGLFCGVKR